jgi:hypothetical protein
VHLRRALLLFAIVLGMAALVASLSRPLEERRGETTAREPNRTTPGPATVVPAPAPEQPTTLTFDAAKRQTKRLLQGTAATLEVIVPEPGSVEIPGLGLSAPAEPLTPARFDLLASDPGTYELVFDPATTEAPEPAGRLVVTSAG